MLEQLPYQSTMRERPWNTRDSMAFRCPSALSNVHRGVGMTDVSRLSIDPVAAGAITSQAAATHVQAVSDSRAKGENAFDSAVTALLAWAGSTDGAVVSAVSARAEVVASQATTGLAELTTMNADNERRLGAL